MLFHFTALPNLESILRNGLVSTKILNDHQAPYIYTDGSRMDGQEHAVFLSIHGINRTMLHQKQKGARFPFVILAVDASVLWSHHCRFCWRNGASSEITRHYGRLDGPWAFERMFEDRPVSAMDTRSSRAYYNTPSHMPTRNDAEVQVLAPIAPDLVRAIGISREAYRPSVEQAMIAAQRILPVIVDPDAFT